MSVGDDIRGPPDVDPRENYCGSKEFRPNEINDEFFKKLEKRRAVSTIIIIIAIIIIIIIIITTTTTTTTTIAIGFLFFVFW